jgi:predicted DNA binding CopG/RHH family protein
VKKSSGIIVWERLWVGLIQFDLPTETMLSGLLEPDSGERGKRHMKKKIKYSDEPMKMKVMEDFLPSPEQLVVKDENVKVTITLSKASIDFFKKHARKQRYPYQKMIRQVLDHYVEHYR